MNAKEFLDSLYEMRGDPNGRKCARHIYKAFNPFLSDAYSSRDLSVVSEICEKADVNSLNTHQILALLTATLPLRGAAPQREVLTNSAKEKLQSEEPGQWGKLLVGLL